MNLSLSIPNLEQLVVDTVSAQLADVLGRASERMETRVAFLTKGEAIRFLGTAIFLKAGEQDGKLTPVRVGGSAGAVYHIEQLAEYARWIAQKAKSGSLPDYYFTNNRNSIKSAEDETEVHNDNPAPGSTENRRANKRDVPRPARQS